MKKVKLTALMKSIRNKEVFEGCKEYAEIQTELNEVQKRARVRTITVWDIANEALIVDGMLHGMAKKYKDGLVAAINVNAQTFPGAYRGIPDSTYFKLSNIRGDWYITEIYRVQCDNKPYQWEELTEIQKDKLVEAVLSGKNK